MIGVRSSGFRLGGRAMPNEFRYTIPSSWGLAAPEESTGHFYGLLPGNGASSNANSGANNSGGTSEHDGMLDELEELGREVLKSGIADDWYQAVVSLGVEQYLAEILCFESSARLARLIAESPSAPPFLLDSLSTHPSHDVRAAVAESHHTPTITQWNLANDANADVRYLLAESFNTDLKVLERLEKDANPYVAARASQTLVRAVFGVARVAPIKIEPKDRLEFNFQRQVC